MAQTPNLALDEIPQGLVRFDTALTRNAKILDALFEGSSATVLGLGDKNRSVVSFRPLGVERAKVGSSLFEMVGVGLKVAAFSGTPVNGVVRLNGTDIEGYANGAWRSLTAGAAGGSVTGSGTSGYLAKWTGTSSIGSQDDVTIKAIISNGSGARTVYTVPTGKKAIVCGFKWTAEATSASVYFVPSGQSAGLSNRVVNGAWTTNNNSASFLILAQLAAGDFIRFDDFSVATTFFATVLEYDDTKLPHIKGISGSSIGNTLTTIYTVPTGKVAFVPRMMELTQYGRIIYQSDQWWVHNTNASSQLLQIWINDGVGDRLNQDTSAMAQNVSARFGEAMAIVMGAGHTLKAKTDVAASGMNFWGLIAEVDA